MIQYNLSDFLFSDVQMVTFLKVLLVAGVYFSFSLGVGIKGRSLLIRHFKFFEGFLGDRIQSCFHRSKIDYCIFLNVMGMFLLLSI